MEEEDRVKRPAPHEVGMNLDAMSVDELHMRIGLLEAEIARLQAAVEARHRNRSAADAFFRS